MENLGGRVFLMIIRADILVGVVLVVAVGVILFGKHCLFLTEVEYLGVSFGMVEGDIFNLGEVLLRWC